MTGDSPETVPAGLDPLLHKARAARAARAPEVDPAEPVRPPRLAGRRAFVGAVSQLHHAERATAAICRRVAGLTGDPAADRLLALQAADETHHAALYGSYLDRLGDRAPPDPAIAEALDALGRLDLGPAAVVAGCNVLLEGEAVKLQHDCLELFRCPALARVTRAAARDEARHVAFGRAWLPPVFAAMADDQRRAIYDRLAAVWRELARPPDRGGRLHAVLRRNRRRYLERRWPAHRAAFVRVGLIAAGDGP